MKFTLIATCLNEINSLPRWMEDIKSQTRFPDEIVITDAESTDGTIEMLLEWQNQDSRIKIIVEKCNAARGRNIAVQKSENEHFICTDMGCRIDKKWFKEMALGFERNPDADILMGNYYVDPDTIRTVAQRAEHYTNGEQSPFHMNNDNKLILKPSEVPSNRNLGITRNAWKKLNGWPEDLTLYADDAVLGAQIMAGDYEVIGVPKAIVYWKRHEKLKGYFREMRGYGKGDGESYIKVPFAFRLYKKKIIPKVLVPFLNGLRLLQIYAKPKNIWRALKSFDLTALLFIFALGFGKGWNFAKGFLVGYEKGALTCKDSRNRVINTPYASGRV